MPESKFQKYVRKIIEESLGCNIQTEVNVKKLFPEYGSSREHYDIVINLYNLIIECHGEQHRSLVFFGKELDETEAIAKLAGQKRRDRAKEDIAWENGWGYIIIWQDELSNNEEEAKSFIMKKILKTIKDRED